MRGVLDGTEVDVSGMTELDPDGVVEGMTCELEDACEELDASWLEYVCELLGATVGDRVEQGREL